MHNEGILIVISAPSGAGKTTLCNGLIQKFPTLKESVSFTTRTPRAGEQDGVNYNFVTVERFKEMIAENSFAEWAEVHDNFYGTSLDTLEQARVDGIDILLDIDCQGAKILKKKFVNAVFVFVLPPSLEELRRRLELRSSDSPDVIERRIARAMEEIHEARWYDYIIVNDKLELAQYYLTSIVTAARLTTRQMLGQVSKMFDI